MYCAEMLCCAALRYAVLFQKYKDTAGRAQDTSHAHSAKNTWRKTPRANTQGAGQYTIPKTRDARRKKSDTRHKTHKTRHKAEGAMRKTPDASHHIQDTRRVTQGTVLKTFRTRRRAPDTTHMAQEIRHTTHDTKHSTVHTGHHTSTQWHGSRVFSDLVAICCDQILPLLVPALRPATIVMAAGTQSILGSLQVPQETRLQVPQDPALISKTRSQLLQHMKDLKMAEAIEQAIMGDDGAYINALRAMGIAYEDPASGRKALRELEGQAGCAASGAKEAYKHALRAMGLRAREELEGRLAALDAVKDEVKDEDLQKDETLQMLLGLQECQCLRAFPCRLKSGHVLDISED